MEPQQLEKLRIRSESKQRRRGTPWLIFGGVLVATAAAVYWWAVPPPRTIQRNRRARTLWPPELPQMPF
jgi:hypothetical protein